MFEKNNPIIALNVLHTKDMEIWPVYISKCNSNCEKQITLFDYPNEKGWHYIAVKNYLHY